MKHTNTKQFKLSELIKDLDVSIQGDANCLIQGVGTIQHAEKGQIAFLMNPKYKKYLATTHASAVIVSADNAKDCQRTAIISADPYFTYAKIARYFDNKPIIPVGIHPTVVIGANCQIDPTACIAAHCVIGDNVIIGAGVVLHPGIVVGDGSEIGHNSYLYANVTLYHDIKIGKDVIIGSGTVIGSDGFGFAKHKGHWSKVPQLGRVVVEDEVEIGALCAIDRGAIGDTVIQKGAKLDNLIQVAHNVRVGNNTAIASQTGISGSTELGKNCLIAGQVGFAGHLNVTDNVAITGGAAITRSIRDPGIYSSGVGGVVTNNEWRKNSARFNRLEKLMDRVKVLEALVSELKREEK